MDIVSSGSHYYSLISSSCTAVALKFPCASNVVTWGFVPDHQTSESIVLQFRAAGFMLIWFDGNRPAALREFIKRGTALEMIRDLPLEALRALAPRTAPKARARALCRLGFPQTRIPRHEPSGIYFKGPHETAAARLVTIRPLCHALIHLRKGFELE
jgi:hypothetical protein